MEIVNLSRVSDGEYALLVANFNRVESRDHAAELKKRGFSPGQIALALQESQKNDSGERHLDLYFSSGFKPDYSGFSYIMSLYHPWSKNGVLPYPGSTSEQPAKIMEMFMVIDKLMYEHEKAEQNRIAKENRRG